MKETTQAFMNVLLSTNMQEKNIKAVTQLLWENLDGMDDLIAFIKDCPDADESEIMKEAVRISKCIDKDNPYSTLF